MINRPPLDPDWPNIIIFSMRRISSRAHLLATPAPRKVPEAMTLFCNFTTHGVCCRLLWGVVVAIISVVDHWCFSPERYVLSKDIRWFDSLCADAGVLAADLYGVSFVIPSDDEEWARILRLQGVMRDALLQEHVLRDVEATKDKRCGHGMP
ncbi:hypothetical protein M514_11755 [Trichuris suis]|uniref:Uncharacterized protein n=1 Tax=Trichuris suis TaxID=68888 RepID=A0A085MVX1_9BILA|nr:hypothetical protein M513_11755 [Trichuris suis]KFD61367.1 hypothetical protein M514_11755 [Trichuris suis]